MAMCHKCKIYLYDTIPHCIKKELAIYDDYRAQNLPKILPELIDWISKVFASIDYAKFCECWANGRMFAKRGKNKEEDDHLLNLSIYYQMKRFSSLLKDDVKHIHILLTESGVLRTKRSALQDELPEKYLASILPNLYLNVYAVHDDHIHPERHVKTQEQLKAIRIDEEDDLYS